MSQPRNERLFELKWKDRTRGGGSGISELAPEWVAEQSRSVWVIDVRERDELVGPLGHIPGSTWVPLERVAEVPAKLGREVPVVLVSRSGRKAGRAALYLQALGMKYVAAMAGHSPAPAARARHLRALLHAHRHPCLGRLPRLRPGRSAAGAGRGGSNG